MRETADIIHIQQNVMSLVPLNQEYPLTWDTAAQQRTWDAHRSSQHSNVFYRRTIRAPILSYLVAIGCIFAKRLHGEVLLPSWFYLSRVGILVNVVALLFLSVAFFFCFFPSAPNPSPEGMNWSSLIFGLILLFSLTYYYLFGRHHYVDLVEYIKPQELKLSNTI